MPNKGQLKRKKGLAWLPFLRQQQEPEAADHISLVVRQQRRKNAGAQFTFSFLLLISLRPIEWCCPHSRWVFLPQLNLSGNALIDRPIRMSVSHINIQNKVK